MKTTKAVPLQARGQSLTGARPNRPRPPDASLPENLDPLRVEPTSLTPDTQQALRERLLEFIAQSLAEMNTYDIQVVAEFADLVNNNHGCSTPVESFLPRLVRRHYLAGGLTPDAVIEEVEGEDESEGGFRVSFEESMEETQRFQAAYPRLGTRPHAVGAGS